MSDDHDHLREILMAIELDALKQIAERNVYRLMEGNDDPSHLTDEIRHAIHPHHNRSVAA